MKTLYESLLDDEEDLVDNDNSIIYDSIINNLSKSGVKSDNVINDKNGISINDTVFSYNWLSSIPLLTEIYHINELKLYEEDYSPELTPIHIHDIDNVIISEDAWKVKTLKVDNAGHISIDLGDIRLGIFKKIMKFVKKTFNNINELEISACFEDEDENFKMKLLKDISGFNVKYLNIEHKFFIDNTRSGRGTYHIIDSEKNSQMFDELFKNNKIQNLRVRNMKSFGYTYVNVIPSSKDRFRYKLTK